MTRIRRRGTTNAVGNWQPPSTITDRFGELYEVDAFLDAEQLFKIQIWHHAARFYVADIVCQHVSSDDLYIGMIETQTSAFPRMSPFEELARALLHHPRSHLNYERRSLGTALLTLTVEFARANHYKHLYGCIVESRLQENPHLIDWYRARGFTISKDLAGCFRSSVASIHMQL